MRLGNPAQVLLTMLFARARAAEAPARACNDHTLETQLNIDHIPLSSRAAFGAL